MRALFYSLLGYFLTPAGVRRSWAHSTRRMVFFLPLGIDFIVIIMAARKPELFWLYAILATVGSLVGAALTFWIGRKVGEHGLVAPGQTVEARSGSNSGSAKRAAFSVGGTRDHPAAVSVHRIRARERGASGHAWHFLVTLAGVRLLRFGRRARWRRIMAAASSRGCSRTTFTIVVGG